MKCQNWCRNSSLFYRKENFNDIAIVVRQPTSCSGNKHRDKIQFLLHGAIKSSMDDEEVTSADAESLQTHTIGQQIDLRNTT